MFGIRVKEKIGCPKAIWFRRGAGFSRPGFALSRRSIWPNDVISGGRGQLAQNSSFFGLPMENYHKKGDTKSKFVLKKLDYYLYY